MMRGLTMTRSKTNYRCKKARKRLTTEALDQHTQLEIVSIVWLAKHGSTGLDDKLNRVAQMRGSK